jgi:hypothetical protein
MAGLAAIHALGLSAVEDAQALGILPAQLMAKQADLAPETSLATWRQTNEAGWGDSDSTVIWIFDGGAGANEVGQGGGLSEANRTLTQVGGIGAAVLDGGYYYRTATGGTYFTWPEGGFNGMLASQSSHTIIIKIRTGTDMTGWFMSWVYGDTNAQIAADLNSGTLTFYLDDGGHSQEAQAIGDALSANTLYYVYLWSDNTFTRIGYSTTLVTKWSEFSATKRAQFAGNFDGFLAQTGGIRSIPTISGTGPIDMGLYFLIVSKTCLITND